MWNCLYEANTGVSSMKCLYFYEACTELVKLAIVKWTCVLILFILTWLLEVLV